MNTRVRGLKAPAATGAQSTGSLPDDLLRQASSRLGLASLVYAITYGTAFYSGHLLNLLGDDVPMVAGSVEYAVANVSIGASLLIFFAVRFVRLPPATVLDFGLLYQIIGSLGIAVAELWRVDFAGQLAALDAGNKPWFGISWVCVWILVFPTVVPSTPGKALLASLASASMAPLALLLSLAAGVSSSAPLPIWVGLMIAVYGSAIIAYIMSRQIYGLGRDIKAARELGSYRLVELLGRGGMGEVWRAEHTLLARPAAIKLIRRESLQADAAGGGVRRRFEREAATTAMLSSPHTVELYDFGIADDGRFYYVMELLDGLDLESFVERFGAVSAARAVSWLWQACDSLGEAHARGLVHRDIKPANIYVCRQGTSVDWVKVLDFGLVKQAPVGADATRLTVEGIAAGTPGYMAPETAEGIHGVDHRADLYALGCVGYWLLTGMTVFDADSPVKMVVDHVHTAPVAPSRRVELSIPAALDDLILSCLAKNPEDRPQSAVDLADRLEALALDDAWTPRDARSWWDLHLPVSEVDPVRGGEPPSAAPTS